MAVKGGFRCVIAAQAGRLAAGDQSAGIEDLETALPAEGGQGALQRSRSDVKAADAVRRLRDHWRRDCHHQRGERG